MKDKAAYLPVSVVGNRLSIGGKSIEQGQQIEIPKGRGTLAGRVVYDECRLYFKLVTPGAYWVVLKSGLGARVVQ